MEQLLTTYKFYDDRKRRLSIFGDYNDNKNGLDITIFCCSKQENFSKEKARFLYKTFKSGITVYTVETRVKNKEGKMETDYVEEFMKPQIFFVSCEKGKTKAPFMEWCKTNYRKMVEGEVVIPGQIIKMSTGKILSGIITSGEDTLIKIKSLW